VGKICVRFRTKVKLFRKDKSLLNFTLRRTKNKKTGHRSVVKRGEKDNINTGAYTIIRFIRFWGGGFEVQQNVFSKQSSRIYYALRRSYEDVVYGSRLSPCRLLQAFLQMLKSKRGDILENMRVLNSSHYNF